MQRETASMTGLSLATGVRAMRGGTTPPSHTTPFSSYRCPSCFRTAFMPAAPVAGALRTMSATIRAAFIALGLSGSDRSLRAFLILPSDILAGYWRKSSRPCFRIESLPPCLSSL